MEIVLKDSKTPDGNGFAVLPIGDKCTIILALLNIDATKELELLTDKLDKLALGLEKLKKAMRQGLGRCATARRGKVPATGGGER